MGIFRFEQEAGYAISDQLRDSANARSNDRLRMGHRLEDRKRAVLVPLGWNDDDSSFSQCGFKRFACQVTDELSRRKAGPIIFQQRPRSGDNKPPGRVVRGMRLQQRLNPFFQATGGRDRARNVSSSSDASIRDASMPFGMWMTLSLPNRSRHRIAHESARRDKLAYTLITADRRVVRALLGPQQGALAERGHRHIFA